MAMMGMKISFHPFVSHHCLPASHAVRGVFVAVFVVEPHRKWQQTLDVSSVASRGQHGSNDSSGDGPQVELHEGVVRS